MSKSKATGLGRTNKGRGLSPSSRRSFSRDILKRNEINKIEFNDGINCAGPILVQDANGKMIRGKLIISDAEFTGYVRAIDTPTIFKAYDTRNVHQVVRVKDYYKRRNSIMGRYELVNSPLSLEENLTESKSLYISDDPTILVNSSNAKLVASIDDDDSLYEIL